MNFELLKVDKKIPRLKIPKRLGLGESWNLVKPIVSKEVGNGIYTPVPYLTETSVYKIGAIFVRARQNNTGCFGPVKRSFKILGPLYKFINKSYSTSDWCSPQLPTIKTTADFLDFKVRLSSGDDEIAFSGFDYHQLKLSELMRPIENLQLNRNSHEDLGTADRIGIINCVAATNKFELRANTKDSSRIFYLGDGNYTILFGYQICHIDRTGVVVSVTNGRPTNSSWIQMRPPNEEDLPVWEPR